MGYGINAPNGLARVGTKMAATDNQQLTYFNFDAENPFTIRQNDPVVRDTQFGLVPYLNSAPNENSGDISDAYILMRPLVGVMRGVTYVDVNGRTQFSDNWVPGTVIRPNTQPQLIIDTNPNAIYSIQASISNAQWSYWAYDRLSDTGGPTVTTSYTTNPVLGIREQDIGLYADIATGGDSFNVDNAGTGAQYIYGPNYSVASVIGQPVLDNPTASDLTAQSPSGFYLNCSTLSSAPVAQAVPNQMSAVRIEALDPAIGNRFCDGPSTTIGTVPPTLMTQPARNSFNNALVSLNVVPDNHGVGVLPMLTASGQIGSFGLTQIPSNILAVGDPLPTLQMLPILGPIAAGKLLIHSAALEFEGGVTEIPAEILGIFLIAARIEDLSVVGTNDWTIFPAPTTADPAVPIALLSGGDLQIPLGQKRYNHIITPPTDATTYPTGRWTIQGQASDTGFLASYNYLGFQFIVDPAADSWPLEAAAGYGTLKWRVQYSVIPNIE